MEGLKEDNYVGNMTKTDATKRQVYISPHDLIKTGNFITVMGFPGLIQRQGLASWNIKIYRKNIWLIVIFVSLQSFNLPVELFLCLFSSCSIDRSL